MAQISELRKLTGAGLMDCKKALAEANEDLEAAIEIIRKKGQAVAAKREDREASEGCVLAQAAGEFAVIVALKCETDFVAKNEGFVNLTKKLLATAVENKAKSIDELKEIEIEGKKVADLIVEEIGKTGEKMELGAVECVEGAQTVAYNHFGNKLATIVAFNETVEDVQVCKEIAMQVAAMNPVACSREDVPEKVINTEMEVAMEKTRTEQIQKFVNGALSKTKLPLGKDNYYAQTEEHLEEAVRKGYLTEEQANTVREIKVSAAKEAEGKINENMVQNIAKGRLNKFYKENVLMEQEFVSATDKSDVAAYLAKTSKTLKATAFKRVNLNQD